LRFRSSGGRRALEEQLRYAEERAESLQATLEALAEEAHGEAPPELYAAAGMAGPEGQAVRLTVNGQEVIAVIGDEAEGSPPLWWAWIRRELTRQIAS
jgi:hypothetical protein